MKKGESVRFYYRIIINDSDGTIPAKKLDKMAVEFLKLNPGN